MLTLQKTNILIRCILEIITSLTFRYNCWSCYTIISSREHETYSGEAVMEAKLILYYIFRILFSHLVVVCGTAGCPYKFTLIFINLFLHISTELKSSILFSNKCVWLLTVYIPKWNNKLNVNRWQIQNCQAVWVIRVEYFTYKKYSSQ